MIRPVALTEEEAAQAPEGIKTLGMIGMPDMKFTMTVSAYDCTGCGSCVNVCPGKKNKETGEVEKALTMASMEENAGEQKYFDFGTEIPVKPEVVLRSMCRMWRDSICEAGNAVVRRQNVHCKCNRMFFYLG